MAPPYKQLPRYMREMGRLFRAERWPIVHSHVNALSVFPLRAAERTGVPVRIAHSHSTAGKGETAKNAAKSVLKRFSNVYPTHRMACSRYAGEWLFGKGAEFEVVYNGICLSRFAFNAEARAKARADLGLAGGQLAVGHVGRFMPQKNHRFLIEEFAELARLRPDAVLLLVGSGEAEALAESWVAERGVADRVMFLGQRDDVDRLYQAFDAFVLPSLYEGLPLVSVEAQAAGLPCFLSERITREVDVTGTVRFLPIEDASVWAEALAEVEPGERVGASRGDFGDYDINCAAERLAARYLGLKKETYVG
ncbi:glycosyltransferase [Collinsella tanakaei]|nr:glycosyltransferase [Collinsella tanakaei]